jgi:hypothetical protein
MGTKKLYFLLYHEIFTALHEACFSDCGNNFLVFSGQCTEAMVQKVHKIGSKKK